MFVELRQYRIQPGRSEEWVKYMEEELIPFQVSKGMVVLGSWIGEQDPTVYVWMRRFESESERERLYKAVYESDTWKNRMSARVGELIDRTQIVVTRLTATPRSVIQ
ncbi:MAG: NIPSNAP family containing protein [Chloroflexota bacterium]|nr:MAG: NIPSNAP family containing protein [Chloroflexota bacterium]